MDEAAVAAIVQKTVAAIMATPTPGVEAQPIPAAAPALASLEEPYP